MELQLLGNVNQSTLQALGEIVDDIDLISGLGADAQHEILLKEMREAEELDGLGSKAKRKARREKRRQKRAKKKAEGKPRGFKKFAFAPARAAFLLAVKVNFLRLATRLATAWNAGHSDKIKSKWLKFGGKPDALKKEIARGAKTNLNGLGEPITTGGAFVLALPIIIAMLGLLKSLGIIKPGKDDEVVDDKLEDIKDLAEGEGYDLGEDGDTGGDGEEGGGGFMTKAGLPLLIGGAALLFLMGGGKKRK